MRRFSVLALTMVLFLATSVDLLELASDEFSNNGCNDYPIENTPENRAFYEKMMKECCGEDITVDPSKEKIYTQDWMVMTYLSKMLKKEAENG